jgi:hypothetical protein
LLPSLPRVALGRAPLRRSALKSIHWIDLTGFAGRASPCIKPRDAQHDLMSQATDGRLKGHVVLRGDAFLRARVSRTSGGSKVYLEASA